LEPSSHLEIEAAVFRALIAHLHERNDVQNIDLMNLAGFCRNCLAKWYLAAAVERNVELSEAAARERVYGMPYEAWKRQYQTPATPEQLAARAALTNSHSASTRRAVTRLPAKRKF
jgi:hypothetical protein